MRKYHTSRWVYWYGYAVALFLRGIAWWSWIRSAYELASICSVTFVLLIACLEVAIRAHRVRLTSTDVVLIDGLLSQRTLRIHYANISDVAVEQSFLQRFLGFGDVHVNTSGTEGVEMVLRSISKPWDIEKHVSEHLHKHKVVHGARVNRGR